MDEQTLSLIEALASLRTQNEDPEKISLANPKKVRTPEGVKKYDQPIGTIITKDMIEKAAKKAAEAATKSLHSEVSGKSSSGSTTKSLSSEVSTSVKSSSSNVPSTQGSKVPGGYTTADINKAYVSHAVSNPAEAQVGWVQKKDGKWYQQNYENGTLSSEQPLDKWQENALSIMENQGLIYSVHVPDPEPKSKEHNIADSIKQSLDSGKTVNDPEVKKLISDLQGAGESSQQKANKDSGNSSNSAKTVKINGKDVKVGRYSRPKGFAKAFLIVNEDGTVEYENKTGARKKISHNAFDQHQKLGMTKFLTSDTGAIKKDQHFEDGKLVNDKAGAQASTPAKVEPMKKTTPEPTKTPVAEKPAQEAPKPVQTVPESTKKTMTNIVKMIQEDGSADITLKGKKINIGFQGSDKEGTLIMVGGGYYKVTTKDGSKYDIGKGELVEVSRVKSAKKSEVEAPKKEETESGTVKIGNLTVKPGRYSRPKGFAKAFLIVHKDGTVEYENKKGERKKIGPKSFEGHWKLGMNKFLTSDTSALKSGESYEDGKLVEESKTPSKPEVSTSPAVEAAKKAAVVLKAKQDANSSSSEPAWAVIKGNKVDIPSGAKVYYHKVANSESLDGKYILFPDGEWGHVDKHGYHKFQKDGFASKQLTKKLADFQLQEETSPSLDNADSKEEPKVKTFSASTSPTSQKYDFPVGTKLYVTDGFADHDTVSAFMALHPDGTLERIGSVTGKKEVTGDSKETRLKGIADGDFVPWTKKQPNEVSSKDISYVSILGNPIIPLPDGAKLYKLGSLPTEEVKVKYLKHDDGSWSAVNSQGEIQANKKLSENLDLYLKEGKLELDTSDKTTLPAASVVSDVKTEADSLVDSGEKISPAASPTEVKSVKISGMDIKPGKYSIGKSFAKAFLLVHPDGTTEYVNKEGKSKKLTPAAFKKNWDAGMNKYAGPLDAAKGPTQAEVAPAISHGLKPGTYYTKLFDTPFSSDKKTTLQVMEDGSGVAQIAGSQVSLTPQQILDSTKYGTLMDEFGNSVLLPGDKPEAVHLFGSTKGISLEDLSNFRDEITTDNAPVLTVMKKYTGSVAASLAIAYGQKFFPGSAEANKKSFVKAIDDILAVVGNKQADKPNVAEVPDPVKSLFKQDEHGYFVQPNVISDYNSKNFHYLSGSEANQAIKAISEEFQGKIATAPSKLSSYAKQDWYYAFKTGDFKTMYQLESSSGMTMHAEHPGAPANKDTHKISWAPSVKGETPAGKVPEGDWSYDAHVMTEKEIDNYLIAANMANPTHLSSYGKKSWVNYHMTGDSLSTDELSLKAQQHAKSYPNEEYTSPPVWTDGVQPKKAYTEFVDDGSQVDYWTGLAIKQYVKDFPDSVPEDKKSSDSYDMVKYVQNHVDTAKAEKAAKEAAELAEKMKPKFQKVPGQGVSGGHHEAMVLQDQFDQKWVYKPRDDEDIFLADVEQAAHSLAKAWGYKTAKSFITEFDDRKGHVQQMFDAEKDLNGVPMSSLTSSQIQDLAKEHLLDWALDNDDSWGANVLLLKNGSIVGIDKGRAFVGIGHWNGLTADSSAHVHMPLVYTDLYNAIASKNVSQEDANAAYFSVLRQARKMEKLPDDKMKEILEEGFKNRKNWTVGGGPDNKEAAIQAALDRKNSLVKDMETLWGSVFNKAGYDKPEAPEGVVANDLDQDVHLGITPAALEQAKANGSYGASVFFGGPEIEDSHLLLYHTKTKEGTPQLNGEMKIRESSQAYKDVESWLKANAVNATDAYGFTPDNMKKVLPNEADYYQKIIAGVKTISAHALDGQYNADSLNGMSWVKNTLKNYVNDYDSKMSNPISQAALVKQYKDPEAFLEMAQKYLSYIAAAEDHKAAGTKSAPGAFTQYVWTPKKEEKPEPVSGKDVKVELRKASSPKANNSGIPKFEEDGSLQHHNGYTTDGNPGSMYLVTLPTGETIEFRGNTTGTPATSKGLTRFTMPAGSDEAASMERIKAQMAHMGLSMEDADEADLELFYWRHLAGIMDTRADSKKNASIYDKTKNSDKYKKFQEERPVETSKMSKDEELEAWKKAFANITSREQIDQFVASGGHTPKFGHYHTNDVEKYSGQPYWERFDVSDEEVFSKDLSGSALSDEAVAEYLTYTGGMLSTEARLRTLGMWKDGMSSSSDQSHGSSGFVFIRQNREVTPSTGSYNIQHIFYSPKILKRTHNYAYDEDKYGEMNSKSESAYFDFDKLTSFQGGTNEIMIKHAVSLLDDIEIVTFEDPEARARAIAALKALGIDEIRGVPIEKRFVMRNKNDVIEAQKVVKEAWKKWI